MLTCRMTLPHRGPPHRTPPDLGFRMGEAAHGLSFSCPFIASARPSVRLPPAMFRPTWSMKDWKRCHPTARAAWSGSGNGVDRELVADEERLALHHDLLVSL